MKTSPMLLNIGLLAKQVTVCASSGKSQYQQTFFNAVD